MTRRRHLLGSTKLTLAAVVATGLAASPVALSPIASAQESEAPKVGEQTGGKGAADEFVQGDPTAFEEEDRATIGTEVGDDVYETLGTTREQAEGAADQMATAQYGRLETYQAEVERNNLDGAAKVLAVVARHPITEAMVVDVNTELGVETNLTADQIAEAAAAVQDESGQRTESGGTVVIITDPAIMAVPVETRATADYDADDADTVYELLGTTREEAESADTHTVATAQYGQLQAYQAEVERGNLDAAADNLAAISERPITEKLVTDVNRELGVETRLTAQQIADAAARKQQAEVPD